MGCPQGDGNTPLRKTDKEPETVEKTDRQIKRDVGSKQSERIGLKTL